MNSSSKTIGIVICVTALIILFIIPIQSMTTPNKRWTFNTWRLHGPKYASHAPVNPTTEPYSSTVPTYVNPQGQFLDIDDDERLKTLIQLLRFLQMLDHEEEKQEKDNGNNQF